MRTCSRADHAHAEHRVQELGYPPGSDKWRAFWDGFLAWITGRSESDCPISDVTDEERHRGRRSPHRRGAWMNGFRAATGRSQQPNERRKEC